MRLRHLPGPLVVAALALAAAVPVRADKPAPPPAPWFVDDVELFDKFTEKVGELAKQKKCLAPARLKTLVAEDRTCRIAPAKPSDVRLDPEEVYERALSSVFIVGSVLEEDGEYVENWKATAWVLAADGVLVTNWHVFEDVGKTEFFGVMDRKGNAYPVTDVLAVNRVADVAVFRVAAAGLVPLPVAEGPARVGSWVGVLGHPGDHFFTFTQGHVSRYARYEFEDGPAERWMCVTAEYASGSSGSPVLDRRGAVAGMAAMTETIEVEDLPPEKPKAGKSRRPGRRADPPKPDDKKPAPPPATTVEMTVKLATPAAAVRKAIGADAR